MAQIEVNRPTSADCANRPTSADFARCAPLRKQSTPFLNLRWFYAVRGNKGAAYFKASVAFALTFIATRVIGYSLGLLDLWRHRALWRPAKWGLYAVIGGVHAGYALNLFWSKTVIGNLIRAARGGGAR